MRIALAQSWLTPRSRHRYPSRPCLEVLEDRDLFSISMLNEPGDFGNDFANAAAIQVDTVIQGTTSSEDVDFFRLTLRNAGRLSVEVRDAATRLSLFDQNGDLLVQSEGQSNFKRDARLVQFVDAQPTGSSFFLSVRGLSEAGAYSLNVVFTNSSSPLGTATVPTPEGLATGDFNHDGFADLASAHGAGQVSVMFGLGDGSFLPPHDALTHGSGSVDNSAETVKFLATQLDDDNHDGAIDEADFVDLLVASRSRRDAQPGDQVAILFGREDGSFDDVALGFAGSPRAMTVGDFNGDGKPDLVVACLVQQKLVVNLFLAGSDARSFDAPRQLGERSISSVSSLHFVALTAGDLNGDLRLDLAVADDTSNDIGLFESRPDGGFTLKNLSGDHPAYLLTGDLDGNTRLDLIVVSGAGVVSTFYNQGAGKLREKTDRRGQPARVVLGSTVLDPRLLQLNDDNDDGLIDGADDLDLVGAVPVTGEIALLPGTGNGAFAKQRRFKVNQNSYTLASADFNGDRRTDLAVGDRTRNRVAFALGLGDGSFQLPRGVVGDLPGAVVSDFIDLNDGRLDLVTANRNSHDVTVLLGLGNGDFEIAGNFAVGFSPVDIVTGDFNKDGRTDIATANQESNDVSILLGFGDGSFQDTVSFGVGISPASLVVGDFDSDGNLDLAVSNAVERTITFLWGLGNGLFQEQTDRDKPVRFALDVSPRALASGDFNRDDLLDLAVVNSNSTLSVLWGQGFRAFTETRYTSSFANVSEPTDITTGTFNDDQFLDLAIATFSEQVWIFLGGPDKSFRDIALLPIDRRSPTGIIAGLFDEGATVDLAVAHAAGVTFFSGVGNGSFLDGVLMPLPSRSYMVSAGDFDGNGYIDVATANGSNDVTVLLTPAESTRNRERAGDANEAMPTAPLHADFTNDGIDDLLTLRRNGRILLRPGKATPGTFGPATLLNPSDAPARNLAMIMRNGRHDLAALGRDSSIVIYSFDGQSILSQPGPRVADFFPVSLVASDLDGDGQDDLVVAGSSSNRLFLFRQDVSGTFAAGMTVVSVGNRPAAISLADMDQKDGQDIIVANQASGDVHVLLNDVTHSFREVRRFRGGPGLYGWSADDSNGIQSANGTVAAVAGLFDGDALSDLVVINARAHAFSVLPGSGSGSFFDASEDLTLGTGSAPATPVAGDFNHDSLLDLAMLNPDTERVEIYTNDGQGHFRNTFAVSGGNEPVGLTVADVNDDRYLDLLVSNEFGDVLILLGRAQGTFQSPRRVERKVTLAVADLNQDGRDDVIVANRALDRLTIVDDASEVRALPEPDKLLGPSSVQTADMNRDGYQDLVVANGGGNNVLVFLGKPDGSFRPPLSAFVGTNPVGVRLADLNRDNLTDLIAVNQGSNDVAVLFGKGSRTNWNLSPGPRFDAGSGPTAVGVGDVTGDGVADLLISNPQNDQVRRLNGLGGGFFDDQAPVLFTVPDPGPIVSGPDNAAFFVVGAGGVTQITATGIAVVSVGSAGAAAALAEDFNGDALTDLLMATDDGLISLLIGDATGFTLLDQLRVLGHPTDLALGTFGERIGFYVAIEGSSVALFREFLDVDQQPGVTGLTSLSPNTVGTVATLLPGRKSLGTVVGEDGERSGESWFTAFLTILAAAVPANPQVIPASAEDTGAEQAQLAHVFFDLDHALRSDVRRLLLGDSPPDARNDLQTSDVLFFVSLLRDAAYSTLAPCGTLAQRFRDVLVSLLPPSPGGEIPLSETDPANDEFSQAELSHVELLQVASQEDGPSTGTSARLPLLFFPLTGLVPVRRHRRPFHETAWRSPSIDNQERHR